MKTNSIVLLLLMFAVPCLRNHYLTQDHRNSRPRGMVWGGRREEGSGWGKKRKKDKMNNEEKKIHVRKKMSNKHKN